MKKFLWIIAVAVSLALIVFAVSQNVNLNETFMDFHE